MKKSAATNEFDRRRDRIAELSTAAKGKPPVAVATPQERSEVTRIEDLAGFAPHPADTQDPHTIHPNHAVIPRPSRDDPHPLRASFACSDFDHELIPGAPIDAIVGETVRLGLITSVSQVTWTMVRVPSGSSTTFRDGKISPDLPGLYVLDVALGGGWTREVQIVAYPEAARHQMIYPPREAIRQRLRLRAITRDQTITPANVIDALESGDAGPVDFGKMIAGFNMNNYHAN